MLCSRGKFWEEDILTADIEEWKKLDASETHPRRLNAKEVLITQKDGNFVFCGRWFSKIIWKRLRIPRTTLRREYTVRRENHSGESHGDRQVFRPEETKDDEGINNDFGPTQNIGNNFIHRHHT